MYHRKKRALSGNVRRYFWTDQERTDFIFPLGLLSGAMKREFCRRKMKRGESKVGDQDGKNEEDGSDLTHKVMVRYLNESTMVGVLGCPGLLRAFPQRPHHSLRLSSSKPYNLFLSS